MAGKDYHEHRKIMDCVRRERNKRKRWLRSRLPLDGDQQSWVQSQIRKIEEREGAEQRGRRDQRPV
jgi:hypothetical protein